MSVPPLPHPAKHPAGPQHQRVVLYYGAWALFFVVSVAMAVTTTILLFLDYHDPPVVATQVVAAVTATQWRNHFLAQQVHLREALWLPESPESRALQWMLLHDELSHKDDADSTNLPSLQRFALIATYLHFDWTIPSSLPVCAWESITCNEQQKVIGFHPTTALAIETSIPTALTYLTDLQSIEIPRLGLQGRLPPEAHAWTDLRVLHLPGNHLTGIFLQDYDEETFYWPQLEHFDVSLNRISDTIPPQVRTGWKHLRVCNVRGNWDLQGPLLEMAIPHWLRTLERLELGETNCGGSLPDAFVLEDGAMLPLEILAAAYTPVTGSSLPTTLGLAAPHLRILSLGLGNSVQHWVPGPIPTSYVGLTALEQLSLVDIRLTGTLPVTSAWTSLRALDLYANPNITGTIPNEWGSSMTSMQIMRLVETGLTGTVPVEFGSMTALTDLGLHRTELTGRYALFCGALARILDADVLSISFAPSAFQPKFASFQTWDGCRPIAEATNPK